MKITKEPFGALKDGTPITRYTMENEKGMRVSVINYGGAIQQILVPDRNGDPVDVVLGYDDIAGYEAGTSCFGAFVGRYANRIKDAAFELNGRRYQLEKNDGENHLHGTFIRTVFDIREQEDGLRLSHTFPDGEEGYPGSLQVVAFYRLMEYNCHPPVPPIRLQLFMIPFSVCSSHSFVGCSVRTALYPESSKYGSRALGSCII